MTVKNVAEQNTINCPRLHLLSNVFLSQGRLRELPLKYKRLCLYSSSTLSLDSDIWLLEQLYNRVKCNDDLILGFNTLLRNYVPPRCTINVNFRHSTITNQHVINVEKFKLWHFSELHIIISTEILKPVNAAKSIILSFGRWQLLKVSYFVPFLLCLNGRKWKTNPEWRQ